jgi:hypothetical protein
MNYLSKLLSELRYSQNHKLRSELSLSQITGFESTQTISKLVDILSKSHLGENVNLNLTHKELPLSDKQTILNDEVKIKSESISVSSVQETVPVYDVISQIKLNEVKPVEQVPIHQPLSEEKKFFAPQKKVEAPPEPEKEETDQYILFIKDKFGGREY